MSREERVEVLLTEEFQHLLECSLPTRYPNIYYQNPFTEEQQHLLRVVEKELVMRPSFVPNRLTGSVNIQCFMSCDIVEGTINGLVSMWNNKRSFFVLKSGL